MFKDKKKNGDPEVPLHRLTDNEQYTKDKKKNVKDEKKNGTSTGPLLAVLGSAARIEGKFRISDSIEIECEVAGEMNVEGKLVVGENGVVQADVQTVDALIKGRYEGDMVATGDVEITDTGRVSGNIETDSLVISKGGFFNGNITKIEQQDKVARKPRVGPAMVEATESDKDVASESKKPASGSGG